MSPSVIIRIAEAALRPGFFYFLNNPFKTCLLYTSSSLLLSGGQLQSQLLHNLLCDGSDQISIFRSSCMAAVSAAVVAAGLAGLGVGAEISRMLALQAELSADLVPSLNLLFRQLLGACLLYTSRCV